jgi:hypothetical protein
MYEVFGPFIESETWHTRHASDEKWFLTTLYKVVWDHEFNPDKLRRYLRAKLKLDENDHISEFSKDVDRYTRDAWAVKDFLHYNSIPKPR